MDGRKINEINLQRKICAGCMWNIKMVQLVDLIADSNKNMTQTLCLSVSGKEDIKMDKTIF